MFSSESDKTSLFSFSIDMLNSRYSVMMEGSPSLGTLPNRCVCGSNFSRWFLIVSLHRPFRHVSLGFRYSGTLRTCVSSILSPAAASIKTTSVRLRLTGVFKYHVKTDGGGVLMVIPALNNDCKVLNVP